MSKVEFDPLDADLLWPAAYGTRVKEVLEESDDIEKVIIRLNLQSCPVIGISKWKEVLGEIVQRFGLSAGVSNQLTRGLGMENFQQRSNDEIRRNILAGNKVVISRSVDRDASYLFDYVPKPASINTSPVDKNTLDDLIDLYENIMYAIDDHKFTLVSRKYAREKAEQQAKEQSDRGLIDMAENNAC